jgi:hypothetical protein
MKTYITIIAIIILIGIFFLGRCSKRIEPIEQSGSVVLDSLSKVNDYLQDVKEKLSTQIDFQNVRIDSLKQVKQRVKTTYRNVLVYRDSINMDSVRSVQIFDLLALACDSVITVSDSLVSSFELKSNVQDSIINVQVKQITLKDSTIQLISLELLREGKIVGQQKAKLKRTRIFAGVSSFVAIVFGAIVFLK